jgi:DNA-binding PadR family transcriptional regulator
MSVRRSLLAILDQGPCYGYQLRAEYARRTGAALNVGQIYTTLDRLERDGMVEKRGTDDRGHTYWGITSEGREDARRWFAEPEAPAARDEQAFKVALAATLPGVDVAGVIAAERSAAVSRLAQLDADRPDAEEVPAAILRAAEHARAAAEVAWLDAVAALVSDASAPHVVALSEERPRRGRPIRT